MKFLASFLFLFKTFSFYWLKRISSSLLWLSAIAKSVINITYIQLLFTNIGQLSCSSLIEVHLTRDLLAIMFHSLHAVLKASDTVLKVICLSPGMSL